MDSTYFQQLQKSALDAIQSVTTTETKQNPDEAGFKAKFAALERVLLQNTTIKAFDSPKSLEDLEQFLRIANSNSQAGLELQGLARQIIEVKNARDEEALNHAEMYQSVQRKLIEREEEINKLKHTIKKMGGAVTPSEGGSQTPTSGSKLSRGPSLSSIVANNETVSTNVNQANLQNNSSSGGVPPDVLTYKLKIRELSTALKAMTEQRNDALEKLENISNANDAFLDSPDLKNTVNGEDIGHEKYQKIINGLKDEVNTLKSKLDQSLNTTTMVKELNKSLRIENDEILAKTQTSREEFDSLKRKKNGLESQLKLMVDDLSHLTDEAENLKLQITDLKKENNQLKANSGSSSSKDADNHDSIVKALRMQIQSLQTELTQRNIIIESLEKLVKEQSEIKNQKLEQNPLSTIDKVETLKSFELEKAQMKAAFEEELLAAKSLRIQALAKMELEHLQESSSLNTVEKRLLEEATSVLKTQSETCIKLKESMMTMRNRVNEIEGQLFNAASTLSTVESEKVALESELQQTKTTSAAQISKFVERIKDQMAEITSLNTKLTSLDELKSDLINIRQERDKLHEDLQFCKKEMERIQLAVSDSQGDDVTNLVLESKLTESIHQNEKLREEIKQLSMDLASRDSDIKNKTLRISELDVALKDIQMIQSSEKKFEQENAALKNELLVTRKNIREFSKHAHSLENLVKSTIEEKDAISAQCEVLLLQYETVNNANEAYKQKIVEGSRMLDCLKASLEELEGRLAENQRDFETFKSARNNLISDLTNELKQQKEAYAILNIEATELRSTAKPDGALSQSKLLFEMDVLQSANELLTSNLEIAKKKIEELEKRDPINLEASATDSEENYQEQIKGLRIELSKLKEEFALQEGKLLEANLKVDDLNRALADKDTALMEISLRSTKVKEQLADEEEKKTKSIQLLRNSKNRIMKLESDLKAAQEEIKNKSSLLSDNESLQARALVQSEAFQKCQNELNEAQLNLGAIKKELAEEKERFALKIKDRDFQMAELERKLQSVSTEGREKVEEMTRQNSSMKLQIADLPERMKTYETNIETLERELETSKHLFQVRSIENDQFKVKITELEATIYKISAESNAKMEEYHACQRETFETKRLLQEKMKELEQLRMRLSHLEDGENSTIERYKQINAKHDELSKQFAVLQSASEDLSRKESETMNELSQSKIKITDLEERLKSLMKEKIRVESERESLISDFKIRETQLKNLNKSLKDECRKLGVTIPSPTESAATSPAPVRRSSASMPRLPISSISTKYGGTSTGISSGHAPSVDAVKSEQKETLEKSKSNIDLLPEQPNPEYLKAVILKFLETKDKNNRKTLASAIAMMLKCTPDELKRVQSQQF